MWKNFGKESVLAILTSFLEISPTSHSSLIENKKTIILVHISIYVTHTLTTRKPIHSLFMSIRKGVRITDKLSRNSTSKLQEHTEHGEDNVSRREAANFHSSRDNLKYNWLSGGHTLYRHERNKQSNITL